MEGKRVDQKIENALREAREASDDDGPGFDDALGKTIPRESDKQLLQEYEERRKNASLN